MSGHHVVCYQVVSHAWVDNKADKYALYLNNFEASEALFTACKFIEGFFKLTKQFKDPTVQFIDWDRKKKHEDRIEEVYRYARTINP